MRYLFSLMVLGALSLAASAEAAWSVDVSDLTTDVTTVGGALLGVALVIYGFRTVRRMVGR